MFKKFKDNFISVLFVLFTVFLVIFSNSNLQAAKSGLELWAKSVVPALLPFFIATELLGHTNVISFLGKFLNKCMRPLFNVPGEGAFAFLMGIISGYPVGAKIVTNFRIEGICNKYEAERLLCFTNNSGPLFILGTVGISMFADTTTGIILFITHFFSCITVGFIFRFWKYNKTSSNYTLNKLPSGNTEKKLATFSNLGDVLTTSIKSAISTVIMIGGFVVLFSVIISILNNSYLLDALSYAINPILSALNIPTNFSNGIISGIIELTNGVKIVSSIPIKNISTNIIISAFLLGFGGFSVLLQVWGIISKTDISIFPYFLAKLLQGTIAALYTYFALHYFNFLNLDLSITPINYKAFLLFIIGLVFIFILFKFAKNTKHNFKFEFKQN